MRRVVLLKSRAKNHGGLEKYASRIAGAFLEEGDRVSILTTGKGDPQLEVPVFGTKTVPWPAFIRMDQFDWFVADWLKKNGADLVFGMDRNRFQTHFRAGNGVHAAYLKSRFQTDPLWKACICRFNPLHRKILELEEAAFENPNLQKLFTNSEMVKGQILEHYSTDPAKIEVIHNGVEWHEMEGDFKNWEKEREAGLKKWNLDPTHFHFLFIGNGYSRKGLDRLLLALSLMKEKPFHLSVIGKDNRIDAYRMQVEKLKLKERVRFFGVSGEIRSFYQMADCLVIPSFYDPFANVTVEALAMGLFVVSSKHNGGHEILNANNGAIIEELRSPDAMIAALQKALEKGKDQKRALLIRESVRHLDFSNQLKKLMRACG